MLTRINAELVAWNSATYNPNALLAKDIIDGLNLRLRDAFRDLKESRIGNNLSSDKGWVATSKTDISYVLNPVPSGSLSVVAQGARFPNTPTQNATYLPVNSGRSHMVSERTKTLQSASSVSINAAARTMSKVDFKANMLHIGRLGAKLRKTASELSKCKNYDDLQKVNGITLDTNTGKISFKLV